TFSPLSDFQPQREFNWLSTELVHWKQLDGTITQGILYKPENFNPKAKYPVLIYYYEQLSHRLFEYPVPSLMNSAMIDIPWFVSHGYIVVTPDIHFTTGRWGGSAYNSVVSLAQWLSTLSFIDSKKIGISGHSRAGSLTNYLETHSNLFAAAL